MTTISAQPKPWPPRSVVVMGVSGSGKTTVGTKLAHALHVLFVDADDLHSLSNREKMASGTPLNDEDRAPWLKLVGEELEDHSASGIVMACSALKHRYRDELRANAPNTYFVCLSGAPSLLHQRVTERTGSLLPPSLLNSQLATLEPLTSDEFGEVVDIATPSDDIVQHLVALFAGPAPQN